MKIRRDFKKLSTLINKCWEFTQTADPIIGSVDNSSNNSLHIKGASWDIINPNALYYALGDALSFDAISPNGMELC